MSIVQFMEATAEAEHGGKTFSLQGNRILRIGVEGLVWIKFGSMIACDSTVTFDAPGPGDTGRKVSPGMGGDFQLSKASGKGAAYVADGGQPIALLEIFDETIWVKASSLVAVTDSITTEPEVASHAHGLIFVKVSGTGPIAVSLDGQGLTLPVAPDRSLTVDPRAVVLWSPGLSFALDTRGATSEAMGVGGGEGQRMTLSGHGFVTIQSAEESA